MKSALKLTLLSSEQRQKAIKAIIDYFVTERDEKIGLIAAEDLLEMFLEVTGNDLFNRGVKDTQKLLKDRFQEIDFEVELLLKDKDK